MIARLAFMLPLFVVYFSRHMIRNIIYYIIKRSTKHKRRTFYCDVFLNVYTCDALKNG